MNYWLEKPMHIFIIRKAYPNSIWLHITLYSSMYVNMLWICFVVDGFIRFFNEATRHFINKMFKLNIEGSSSCIKKKIIVFIFDFISGGLLTISSLVNKKKKNSWFFRHGDYFFFMRLSFGFLEARILYNSLTHGQCNI